MRRDPGKILWTITAADADLVCALHAGCNGAELSIERGDSTVVRELHADRATAYDRARVLRGDYDAAVSREGAESCMVTTTCTLRPWRPSDALAVSEHANNPAIGRNLRDGFPYPYTRDDAVRFIESARALQPLCRFAIVVQGEAIGSIGFVLHPNVERVSAEVGYWLGERFWGRGIMSDAVRAVTRYAIEHHGLTRVFAVPYEWNPASFRVLEKAGFVLEGRMRRSAIKDGQIIDQLLYAYVAEASGSPDARLRERSVR